MGTPNRQLPSEAELAYLRGDMDGHVVVPSELSHYAALIDGMIATAKPQLKYLANFYRLGSYGYKSDPGGDWPDVEYADNLSGDESVLAIGALPDITNPRESVKCIEVFLCRNGALVVYEVSRHYDDEYRNWPPDLGVFRVVTSEALVELADKHQQAKPVIARSFAQFSSMACVLNPQFLTYAIYEKLHEQLQKLAEKNQERANAAKARAERIDELRGRIKLGFRDPE